jgi:WD40 repeat protein
LKRITLFFCIALIASLCSQTIAQEAPSQKKLGLQVKATLVAHENQVFDLAFTPNGEILATGDGENDTRLWNTTTGQPIAAVKGITPRFSPDGHLILTTIKKTAKLWDARTGDLRFTLSGHERDITAVSFNRDGTKLATGSEDGTVKLWDTDTGRVSATLTVWRVKKLPRYRLISRFMHIPVWVFLKFSPDQQRLLTTTYWEDSPAKLWDVKTGGLQAELRGQTVTVNYDTKVAGVTSASFSPDGKYVVTLSNYSKASLWDTTTAKLVQEFDVFARPDFSPDSKWFGLIRIGKETGLINLETAKFLPIADLDTGFLNQHSFSPDGRTYVIGSGYDDYHATLIDVATGQVRAKISLVSKWGFDLISNYQKDVDILDFHPGSEFLIGASRNSVTMWDVSTGAVVWQTTEGRAPAEFSRDGKLLATVGKDKKTVLLWSEPSRPN